MRTAPKWGRRAEERSEGREASDLVHRDVPGNPVGETPKNGFRYCRPVIDLCHCDDELLRRVIATECGQYPRHQAFPKNGRAK
jgi:hypothetical protein